MTTAYIAVFGALLNWTQQGEHCNTHCESPETIDIDRAKRAKERAEGRLTLTPDIDVERTELAQHGITSFKGNTTATVVTALI